MKIRIDYGDGTFWLDGQTTPVAGVWEIGQRKDENPGRRAQGLSEWGYGLSNWGVYHAPTGLVACWVRGRRQAESLARQLANVWNGEAYDDDVPLEVRNQVYKLCQDAPGRIQL